MKTGRLLGSLFLVMVLVMYFCIGTSGAQTVIDDIRTDWLGSTWQVSVTQKGYKWSGDLDVPYDAKIRGTVKFFATVNDISETGTITVIAYLPTCEVYGPIVMNYLAGDSLNFLVETEKEASVFGLSTLVNWTGNRNKKGDLKGKLTSLGGYGIGVDPLTGHFQVAELKTKGISKDHACTPVP